MTRVLLSLLALLLLGPVAAAQDMPLSQILIDGDGWMKVEPAGPRPSAGGGLSTLSPDRGTVFTWPAGAKFLYAQATPQGAGPPAPYAPLRLGWGAKATTVTSLATDKDGRIYATTPVGVQVFDPTGRLCGVVTSPAPGPVEGLTFEGDRLTAWVGAEKYARKLKTTGVK